MTDIEKKIERIEKQLEEISSELSSPDSRYGYHLPHLMLAGRSDEIDLRKLITILWQGKWRIVVITFLFAVAGVFYALSLPNMYKSEGVYAPAQKQSGGALGGQLGGLASLAGVNLGGEGNNDIDQAIKLMSSWPFIEKVIEKHKLKPLLLGVRGWDQENKKLLWNEEVYSPNSKRWLREPPPGGYPEPSSYEAYLAFKEMLEVSYDGKTGMITVIIEHYSPSIAQQWVVALVSAVNEHFQLRDMSKAKKSINYLQQKISETGIAEMQAVFYGMIESQTKTLMLAEVDERYLLVDVVPPKISEVRSFPNRAFIAFLFTFLGGVVATMFVFGYWLIKKSREN